MKYKIKDRWDGKILYADEAESFKALLEAAVKARANLVGANLYGANLDGANLVGANLVGADLVGANLDGADLDGANLDGANLDGANLYGANLDGADLDGANLVGANLYGANLDGAKMHPTTRLPTGETWKQYLDEVVPALMAAGGHKVTPDAWECHSWDNCPMHQAFSIGKTEDAPILLRPRVDQFIRFFDAKLIPLPECVKKNGNANKV